MRQASVLESGRGIGRSVCRPAQVESLCSGEEVDEQRRHHSGVQERVAAGVEWRAAGGLVRRAGADKERIGAALRRRRGWLERRAEWGGINGWNEGARGEACTERAGGRLSSDRARLEEPGRAWARGQRHEHF